MSTSLEYEAHKSPEVLEQEINAKRQSISDIVDSLESRFTPGQLVDQALAYTKGNGSEFFQNLGTTLKNNPVPTALTGLGLAWLAMNQNKPFNPSSAPTGPGLGEKISEAFHQVTGALAQAGDSVHHATDSAKAKGQSMLDKASDFSHRTADSFGASSDALNDSAHNVGSQINAQASQLKGQFTQAMNDQPLLLAAIGIALGAAIGAALPSSRKEDQLFGKASDQAVAQVKATGEAAYSVAKEPAEHAVDAIKPSAAQATAPETAPSGPKVAGPAEAGTDLSGGLGIRP